jgi:hypothetical protein
VARRVDKSKILAEMEKVAAEHEQTAACRDSGVSDYDTDVAIGNIVFAFSSGPKLASAPVC